MITMLKNHTGSTIAICLVGILLVTGCIRTGVTPEPDNQVIPPSLTLASPSYSATIPEPTVRATPVSQPSPTQNQASVLNFSEKGHTAYGEWSAEITVKPAAWQPGLPVNIQSSLKLTGEHLQGLTNVGMSPDGFCLLVTAERTFDAEGWLRLPSDERMSTLLTPTGLAIEGGVQGAVTNRFAAYDFRTPIDEFQIQPLATSGLSEIKEVAFNISTKLPDDLPPGIYRIRLDYGITSKKRNLSLNGETFAGRPANPVPPNLPVQSDLYSPPIRASGKDVAGQRWMPQVSLASLDDPGEL
jgi:hypothetical protein